MSNKITLEDFGKLVKPKVLVEAFLLCNKDVDAGDWWKKVIVLNANSKSYKRDTIESTYGVSINSLFNELDINTYIATVNSFVVFHQGRYQFVYNAEQAKKIIASKRRYSIRAVGVAIYHSYDLATKALGDIWQATDISTIKWFYHPKHLIDAEIVEAYESVGVGDMLVFKKTQALVTKIKILKRNKFWITCSWTRKKITMLNGSTGHQVRLNTSRTFTVLKSKH
jgi:hypothetical protein